MVATRAIVRKATGGENGREVSGEMPTKRELIVEKVLMGDSKKYAIPCVYCIW